jgi:hypothetical protein
MPLTRFPDHEDKRVFLSTVLSLDLSPPAAAFSDRVSVALVWADTGSPAASEMTQEFALTLIEHGAMAIVCGGTAAEEIAAIFDEAAAETVHAEREDEAIAIWADAEGSVEDLLFSVAEEAMPPDAFAGDPWDLVVWARSGDPVLPRLREALGRLGAIVDERYELGGDGEG